jgi:hypothetical protein
MVSFRFAPCDRTRTSTSAHAAWSPLVAGILFLLTLVACEKATVPTPAGSTPVGSTQVSTRPTAATMPERPVDRYPNVDRFFDPFDRFTYQYAHDACRISTAETLSEAYGGDPTDLTSVAQAYATFASGPRLRPGFFGCLDALQANRT